MGLTSTEKDVRQLLKQSDAVMTGHNSNGHERWRLPNGMTFVCQRSGSKTEFRSWKNNLRDLKRLLTPPPGTIARETRESSPESKETDMSVEPRKRKGWSTTEDELLVEMARDGKPHDEIAAFFERTVPSIASRLYVLRKDPGYKKLLKETPAPSPSPPPAVKPSSNDFYVVVRFPNGNEVVQAITRRTAEEAALRVLMDEPVLP